MARTKSKVCSVTGLKTSENNFYANNNSSDGLHPYHKYYDNVRRTHGMSVDKLREIINFKNQ